MNWKGCLMIKSWTVDSKMKKIGQTWNSWRFSTFSTTRSSYCHQILGAVQDWKAFILIKIDYARFHRVLHFWKTFKVLVWSGLCIWTRLNLWIKKETKAHMWLDNLKNFWARIFKLLIPRMKSNKKIIILYKINIVLENFYAIFISAKS